MFLQPVSNNTSPTFPTASETLSNLPNKEERFRKRLIFCIQLLQMVEDNHKFNALLSLPSITKEQRKALVYKPEEILVALSSNWNNQVTPDSTTEIIDKVSAILFKHGFQKHLNSLQGYRRIAAQCFKQFTLCFNTKLPSEQLYERMKQFLSTPSSLPLNNGLETGSQSSEQDKYSLPLMDDNERAFISGYPSSEVGAKHHCNERTDNLSFYDENDSDDHTLIIDESSDTDTEERNPHKRRRNNETRSSSPSTPLFSENKSQPPAPVSLETSIEVKEITTISNLNPDRNNIVQFNFTYPPKDNNDIIKSYQFKAEILRNVYVIFIKNPNLEINKINCDFQNVNISFSKQENSQISDRIQFEKLRYSSLYKQIGNLFKLEKLNITITTNLLELIKEEKRLILLLRQASKYSVEGMKERVEKFLTLYDKAAS